MDVWSERLAGIDDDYLVGISNKGIVKRAYKDKEEGSAEIGGLGDEATVKIKEETVTVRFPLGESKCTCPSRSICRHVVQAILVLRESCLKNAAGPDEAEEAVSGEENAVVQKAMSGEENAAVQKAMSGEESVTVQKAMSGEENGTVQEAASGGESAAVQEAASGERSVSGEESASGQETVSGESGSQKVNSILQKEINEYSFSALKKALGSRSFQSFVNQAASGVRPKIQYSTIITVQLPEQGMVVKLLSPLEYSSCTCHKKELCRHKAAAILWCQIEAGILTKEALLGEAAEGPAMDMAEVRKAAEQMRVFLEELFSTGLARVSPDVLDYLERLAIISHNAELARFEGYFRALSDSYDRYFARKAAFRTEELVGQLTRLYRRTTLLLAAKEAGEAAKLAGAFRADYLPVGNLDLIGIAMEHFKSRTGYEGETVYFLEENTKKWYTYTNARPVFYDTSRRRGYTEKSQAPWGLNLSLEKLLKVRIHLVGARCDGRNRLSGSQDTKGEITGEQGLGVSEIKEWYYRDFDKLFREQIAKQQTEWLGEQNASREDSQGDSGEEAGQKGGFFRGTELVFVRPDSCAKAEYSQTGQQLTLPLYDRAGRELLVEVIYSREEAGTIRYLERISERKLPCFLGKVTLRDGRLRMYPVDLPDIEEPFDGEIEEKGGGHTDRESADTEAGAVNAVENTASAAENTVFGGHRPGFLVIEDMAREIRSLMEDLYQSGFGAVHDSTLEELQKSAKLTAQYGMQYLSELLAALSEKIEANRHRMRQEIAPLAELYVSIDEYLYICIQKTAYDRGGSYYS